MNIINIYKVIGHVSSPKKNLLDSSNAIYNYNWKLCFWYDPYPNGDSCSHLYIQDYLHK